MALRAVEEPRLMHARRVQMMRETKTALSGMFLPGDTLDSHFEKGRPPSRANDQVCLEQQANSLMAQQIRSMMTMAVMTFVAA